MKKKQLLLGLVLSLFVVAAFGVPAAHAQSNKPTVTTQNQNQDDGNNNDRPGWGNGDKNHHHVGPPGHSVRPGDGDNDSDNHDNGNHISQAQIQQFFAELHALVIKFFG